MDNDDRKNQFAKMLRYQNVPVASGTYVWDEEMSSLLLWMRSKGMPFTFCAEVIGREVNHKISSDACVGRYHRLIGKALS